MSATQQGPRTKVSAQEELLYGPNAGLVRRLGRSAEEAAVAAQEAFDTVQELRDADMHEMGKVRPSARMDEHGRSEFTVAFEPIYEEVSAAAAVAQELFTSVAERCVQQWRAQREEMTKAREPQEGGGDRDERMERRAQEEREFPPVKPLERPADTLTTGQG